MDSIEVLLREEIQTELEVLGDLEPGSDEHKAAVDGAVKMMDRYIEMKKADMDIQDKREARENEIHQKRIQLKHDQKFQIARIIIDVAGIMVPIAVTIWGTKKSFEFEKEGTITTIMGKGFIGNLGRLFRR